MAKKTPRASQTSVARNLRANAALLKVRGLERRVERLEIQVAELSLLWVDLNNSEPIARRKVTKQ